MAERLEVQRAVAATPGLPVIPESALRATLGILARTVAPGKPRPAYPAP